MTATLTEISKSSASLSEISKDTVGRPYFRALETFYYQKAVRLLEAGGKRLLENSPILDSVEISKNFQTPVKISKNTGTPARISKSSATLTELAKNTISRVYLRALETFYYQKAIRLLEVSGKRLLENSSTTDSIYISKNSETPTEISKNAGIPIEISKNAGIPIEVLKNSGTLTKISKNSGTPTKILK
jgi:hypothetical protein